MSRRISRRVPPLRKTPTAGGCRGSAAAGNLTKPNTRRSVSPLAYQSIRGLTRLRAISPANTPTFGKLRKYQWKRNKPSERPRR